jgi:predicted acylesterase/phospholipase RssA
MSKEELPNMSEEELRKQQEKELRIQQEKPYTNLTLSGGGVKGALGIGAAAAMKEEGTLKGIKEIAGSSAGALL